jgi:uncharacterized repeat protein (TIGR01451 family)
MNAMLAVFVMASALAGEASAQDFTFSLEPSLLTLVPGQSASFVVSVTPLDGFTQAVTFIVSNLPSGVTASFSPAALIPPGTSLLTLVATTNASNGAFTLDVTGVGGGITNTVSSSVSVSFGLLPICTGAFQGTVTDIQTGLPVPNATINAGGYSATANASGEFLITNLPLASSENLPEYYTVSASRSNYWSSYTNAYAVCAATNIVNLQMLLQQEGSISGVVTAEGGEPLSNVTVTVSYPDGQSMVTGTNGAFQFEDVSLGNNNAPAYYAIYAQSQGYWEVSTNIIVQGNSNAVVDLVATPICYATVTGSVVYSDTGLPATNLPVSVSTGNGIYTTTDSQGNYTVTNAILGTDNVPVNGSVEASAAGYYASSTNIMVSNCNQTVTAPVLRLTPVPVIHYNYGAITGVVLDVQTRQPITNAYVSAYNGGTYTDSNGDYAISNLLVGSGATTNSTFTVYAEANNYFESASNVTVNAGETSTQDFNLLRIAYGEIEGTVLNAATGLPVAGVYVNIANGVTGADGHYMSSPIPLNSGNVPTYYSFYASETGYYTTSTNTTITNNITNVVNIELIQVCTGATIAGNVVNAITQKPVTNATITVSGSEYQEVMTDSNGNFIVTNVMVGNDNSPIETTITASAPGFNPQSKTVTIFCSATISTEFGAPVTSFGAIDGYVTNVITGKPLTNVFIGSSFGEATYTDTNGYYTLTQAPLGAGGASRTWTVTAAPTGYPPQTQSVVVSSNLTSRLDFGFGQQPTALVISAAGAPNPVTVGSNLVYTVTLTNSVANAANVLLKDTLPSGVTFVSASVSQNPGGAFSDPVLTNGIVTALATNLSSNSLVVLLITVIPETPGMITNQVSVTSDTPDLDPAGTNHNAIVITSVIAALEATSLIVMVEATPSTPVPVGSNLVYTVTLTNTVAEAADVQLVDTLPPSVKFISASVSNAAGGTFSNPVFSDGTVTTGSASFASNSAVVLYITVMPTVAGTLTNLDTVTSSTTNLGPGTTLNATVVSTAVTSAPPVLYADVGVSLLGSPNPVLVSNQLTYTLFVTNSGPSSAPATVLTDSLPASVTFSSATVSQGGYVLIPSGVQWNIGTLTNHGSASATIVILPLLTGTITNTATVSITPQTPAVTDPNPDNNTATLATAVTARAITNVSIVAGAIVFNPQTGLFQQNVQFNNLSGTVAAAVRLGVLNLPAGVQLYNARGTTNGMPYVEYDQPVAAGGNVTFLLEYYESTRQPFVSTNFDVSVVAAVVVPTPTGTYLQLDTTPFMSEGQLTIEFASVPGHTYVIQYSSDMKTWLTAAPPIVAVNTRTQWVDSGPPETQSPPGTPGQRFYRVVQTN